MLRDFQKAWKKLKKTRTESKCFLKLSEGQSTFQGKLFVFLLRSAFSSTPSPGASFLPHAKKIWRTSGWIIVSDLLAVYSAFSHKSGFLVKTANVLALFTKVEGQRVTVSTKESVPKVSGAFTGAKANPSDTAAQASSQRWVPPHAIRESENSNDAVFRRVRAILNKLTPEKFEKLSDELLHVGIETKFILKGIILLVYEKALDEPKYSSLYAQLCLRFSELAPNFDDPGKAGHSTFRRLLLKQCEEEFSSRSKTSTALDRKDGVLSTEEEEQRASNKRKMLGNIKFIGELGKLGMLHEAILHKCIKQLLVKKKRATVADISEDMECLCHLMKTVGSLLDVVKARPLFDQYFDRIQHILDNTELPSRNRFMLQDILELRRNKWVPRRTEQDNAPPRPIHEIRQEAWQSKKVGMMHPGDLGFPYGPRYNKRGKMTAGRGFEDVFMSDSSFDSFLPMDDFRDMRINDSPFDVGHSFPGRFDELPPVRPSRDEDPYFSSMKPRSTPPDFMPNFQNAAKKPQINDGRPRRVQAQKGRTADGQISLRPVRDSIVAQPTSLATRAGQATTNQQRQTNGQAVGVNEKPKPSKKSSAAAKVDTDKLVSTIVEEFIKSRNEAKTIKDIKDLNSSQSKEALLVKLLQTVLPENEEFQNLAGELLKKCFVEKILTKENLSKSIDSYIRKLSNSDKESDVIKEALGRLSARLVIEGVFDLHTASMLEGIDLLFIQCLKDLKQQKGEGWLLELFNNSKVNLMTILPEQYKNTEKMTEILQEQGLIFLSPQLKAHMELFNQIQSDSNVSSLYKWIKDNIDVKFCSSPEFASVLTTCVLKYVTMTTSLAPNVDRTQPLDKEIQELEKSMMLNMKPLLQKFLNDNVQLQVTALYSLQVFCHCNDFPKGLLLRMFVTLYDLEIIEEDAFISWKEDVNDQHPGKGQALFQVNSWLTWLETAVEESSESEPE